MNRSLEALAIFVICLGGILAVVRFSTSDQTAASRNVAKGGSSPAVPAQGSSSAADRRADPPMEAPEPIRPAELALDYAQGCGLDREVGRVYTPQIPLLSQREIAARAIRSEPWPLLVLADPSAADLSVVVEEVATGYDRDYDAAMFSRSDREELNEELSHQQTEADYAAAELAAAFESNKPATSDRPADHTWNLLTGQLASLRSWSLEKVRSYDSAYLRPAYRAVEQRSSDANLPALLTYPRAKSEARRQLLLRQRAAAGTAPATGQVTWDDYLSFAERHLQPPAEHVVRERKEPKSRLFPR